MRSLSARAVQSSKSRVGSGSEKSLHSCSPLPPTKCMVRRVASSRILERLGVVCKNVSGLLVERVPGHDEDSRAPVLIKGPVTLEPFFITGLGRAVRLFRHLVSWCLADRGRFLCNDRARLVCSRLQPPLAKRLARQGRVKWAFLPFAFAMARAGAASIVLDRAIQWEPYDEAANRDASVMDCASRWFLRKRPRTSRAPGNWIRTAVASWRRRAWRG